MWMTLLGLAVTVMPVANAGNPQLTKPPQILYPPQHHGHYLKHDGKVDAVFHEKLTTSTKIRMTHWFGTWQLAMPAKEFAGCMESFERATRLYKNDQHVWPEAIVSYLCLDLEFSVHVRGFWHMPTRHNIYETIRYMAKEIMQPTSNKLNAAITADVVRPNEAYDSPRATIMAKRLYGATPQSTPRFEFGYRSLEPMQSLEKELEQIEQKEKGCPISTHPELHAMMPC